MTVARSLPFRLTRPVIAEHPLQAQIAAVLTKEIAPAGRVSPCGVVWYSIDHADYAGSVPGIRLGRGVVAGIPDTFVIWRGIAHFVEIKRQGGELSDGQRALCAALLASGGRVGAATCAEEFLACLDAWGVPRARRVRLAA